MSFFTPVTRTQITGLSAATWNTVSLGSFVSIPTGATGVVLEFNTNSTGTTWGAQKAGGTEDLVHAAQFRMRLFRWVEIVSGQVELYLGSTTNGAWWILGYESHVNYLATPVEKGGVGGAGTYTLDYSAELPSDAASGAVIFELSANIKIGAVGNTSAQPRSYQTAPRSTVAVPLNSSRQCQFVATAAVANSDLRVVGWAKAGAFSFETTWPLRQNTVINTWEDTANVRTTTVWDNWRMYVGSDSVLWGIRKKGDSFSDTDTNTKYKIAYVEPDVNGKIQTFSSNTANEYYLYGGWVAALAPASISTINQLVTGSLSTATISNTTFIPTTFDISDGAVTKTVAATYVSAGVYSFTPPAWVDGSAGLKYGSVNITASDGVESTPVYAMTLSPATGDATQIADSISTYNYGAGWTPPLKIGTQALYVAAQVHVFEDMTIESVGGFTGMTSIWDRDPDDKIARVANVTINDGGGLTSSGLTSSGLTRAGLTSVGL